MLRSYLRSAWRHMAKNKGYSALNIFGLAMGMAVALMIGLWVRYQFSYDRFLPGYTQLYQVARDFNSNGDKLTFTTTSLKLANTLRKDIPEIEYVAETDWMDSHGLIVGDKKFYLKGGQVADDFLKIFQYELLAGNASAVMKDPYSIVLTQSTAIALFGLQDPIGKMVRFDNADNLKVTGILKDLPANSSFQFSYLIPFSYFEKKQDYVRQARAGNYSFNAFQIFVRLKPGVTYTQVAPKIKNLEKTEKENTNAMNSEVILQPTKDWHLYAHNENNKDAVGIIDYVRMFTIIGVLVLLIACINFINLTTARSEKRAREVGVRKAIGSRRKDLVIQFLTESFLLSILAFLVSLILVQLALPSFNSLTNCAITIPVSQPLFWIVTVGGLCLTALVAGSRPAFYLSSFNPVKVLKGTMHTGKAATLPRRILVVTQFSCSIALIIGTLVVYQQIQYAKNRPTGYDTNRLMSTDMNGDLYQNFTALKNELLQKGIVETVTTSSTSATFVNGHSDIDHWPGKMAGETVEMGLFNVSDDYFKTLKIPMVSGRDFENLSDTLNVIFNEQAIRRLRIKNPLNQVVVYNNTSYRIIGIAKDALMVSPFQPADPSMFFYQRNPSYVLLYRLAPHINTQEALRALTPVFTKYNPAYPYSYEFVDQNYAAKFNLEELIGKLAGIFALLAIFISCLGLFGLAAYVAEQRNKEIAIRKVLGASVSQVWLLLSGNFILMVLISCVIASPLAFFFLNNWLHTYSYRITIRPFVFLWAGLAAIAITLVTISFQAIRAAIANPVKSLKTE